MKLVFLSHDNNCDGGAQKCLLDLLKGIKQNHPRWQIYMIFPEQGDFIEACSPFLDGYKIFRTRWWLVEGNGPNSLNTRFIYIRKLLKDSLKVSRYLRRIKPDYGITNTIVVPHLAISCKFLGVKHCWFIHEIPDVTWSDNSFVFKPQIIVKLVDKLSAKVLVPSDYARHYYQNIMSGDKLNAITQAVDLPESNLNQNRDAHERYTILLVGAFDSNKGQMELLQAVKEIVDAGRDIYCYLVGPDIGLMPTCQDYVRANNLDNNVKIVSFTKQISLYYYMTDVLLVCSTLESFGRVAVEGQKCGLPVILSDVGANPERIENGVNGLLYQKGNVADLVEKIEMLRDATVRKTFSENINSVMLEKKYSIDNFASEFSALLKL